MSKSRKGRGWTPIQVPDAVWYGREAGAVPVLYAFRSEAARDAWVEDGAVSVGPPSRWAPRRKETRWVGEREKMEALARGDGWPVSGVTMWRMMII